MLLSLVSHKFVCELFQSRNKGAMMTAMDIDKTCCVLFTADDYGFVCKWNIDGYCLDGPETKPAECKYKTNKYSYRRVLALCTGPV